MVPRPDAKPALLSRQCFEELRGLDAGELRICPRLTALHIEVNFYRRVSSPFNVRVGNVRVFRGFCPYCKSFLLERVYITSFCFFLFPFASAPSH